MRSEKTMPDTVAQPLIVVWSGKLGVYAGEATVLRTIETTRPEDTR